MEFLKRMKSREMVEMTLKTIAAVIVGIILIFLMEKMIFGIYMKKINENTASQHVVSECVVYCEEVAENEFKVYLHNTEANSWHVLATNKSKADIESTSYAEVIYRAPNAFEVSITNSHYIVMAAFLVCILGFYGWRFIRMNQDYRSYEKKFKKTGKIF